MDKAERVYFKKHAEERLPHALAEREMLDIEIQHLKNFLSTEVYRKIGNKIWRDYEQAKADSLFKQFEELED